MGGVRGHAVAIHWLVPGDPDTRTGGYRYDREIVAGLRALGHEVVWHRLADDFPAPSPASLTRAAGLLRGLPDGQAVVIDGLAGGVLAAQLRPERRRLRLIALVHHPLADEAGLDDADAAALARAERASLATVERVIVTSPHTARALHGERFRVEPGRLRVVVPGTAPAAVGDVDGLMDGSRLLMVASLTPRKAHNVLFEALAGLPAPLLERVQLRCAGASGLSCRYEAQLLASAACRALAPCTTWLGALDDAGLDAEYRAAGLLVLPSLHEGYGMVLTEALARGVPVLSTTAGAIPDTVPDGAGLLVAPGNVTALREALTRWLTDGSLRERLRRGARAARTTLPDWPTQSRAFASALGVRDVDGDAA